MKSERSVELSVSRDHPAFAGHFPGMPIVPGVVLLDWVIAAIERAEKRQIWPGQLSVVKFLSPVPPAVQLLLHYFIDAADKIEFRIEFDGRPVATGSLRVGGCTH